MRLCLKINETILTANEILFGASAKKQMQFLFTKCKPIFIHKLDFFSKVNGIFIYNKGYKWMSSRKIFVKIYNIIIFIKYTFIKSKWNFYLHQVI